MMIWVVLLVFFVPLIVFLLKVFAQASARDARLIEIRDRLRVKKVEEIEKKKQRIAQEDLS